MKNAYLEVTYRNGRPLAAYYYLPRREGDTSARTERCDNGMLVDFSEDGRPIGIEIPALPLADLPSLNSVLRRLGQPPVRSEDLAPILAA